MDSRRRSIVAFLLVLIFVPGRVSLAEAAPYTVVDLGTLEEGNSIVVRGLNNNGEATGASVSGRGHGGFVVAGGRIDRAGVRAGGDHSVVRGINDAGDIVGSANTSTAVRAFRASRGGALQELAPLPGDSASEAFAVNTRGDTVGFSSGPAGLRAGRWTRAGAVQSPGARPGGPGRRGLGLTAAGP